VRLFVALNLPETVRTSLSACVRLLQSMGFALRWVTPAAGAPGRSSSWATWSLSAKASWSRRWGARCTGARPVTLALGGFGVFPHTDRPRVVWVGVAPEPALRAAAARMEQEFRVAGFPDGGSGLRPHITLGGPGRQRARDASTTWNRPWPICARRHGGNHDGRLDAERAPIGGRCTRETQ